MVRKGQRREVGEREKEKKPGNCSAKGLLPAVLLSGHVSGEGTWQCCSVPCSGNTKDATLDQCSKI